MKSRFVVAWDNPAPYELVQRRLEGQAHVEVIMDRRFRARRRRDEPPPTERRRAERRDSAADATLRELGWVWISDRRRKPSRSTPVAVYWKISLKRFLRFLASFSMYS